MFHIIFSAMNMRLALPNFSHIPQAQIVLLLLLFSPALALELQFDFAFCCSSARIGLMRHCATTTH